MQHSFPIGTYVFVWARPETDLVLIFGKGVYEGSNYINANEYPVVKFANGTEATIHQIGIQIGRCEVVEKTLKDFGGDIIEWDLARYLNRELPPLDMRKRALSTSAVNGAKPVIEPKTVSDRMLLIKGEIELDQKKILLFEKAIADAKKRIEERQVEIAKMRTNVIAEMDKVLEGLTEDDILAMAERIKKEREALPPPPPTPHQEAVAPNGVTYGTSSDSFEAAALQAAVED